MRAPVEPDNAVTALTALGHLRWCPAATQEDLHAGALVAVHALSVEQVPPLLDEVRAQGTHDDLGSGRACSEPLKHAFFKALDGDLLRGSLWGAPWTHLMGWHHLSSRG